jgi:phage tail sheath protein FI
MPEYLAPAVYVEETSFRSKSIEGVGTSTAAFVGLTARGPSGVTPPLLTSFSDYERYYGGLGNLKLGTSSVINHMAHAAFAFFNNGGGRLYVSRILGPGAAAATSGVINAAPTPAPAPAPAPAPSPSPSPSPAPAPTPSPTPPASNKQIGFTARYTGGATLPGEPTVNYRVRLTQAALNSTKKLALSQPAGTLVKLGTDFFVTGNPVTTTASDLTAWDGATPDTAVVIYTVSADVIGPDGVLAEYGALGFSPLHPRYIGTILNPKPPIAQAAMTNAVQIDIGDAVTPFELQSGLMQAGASRVVDLIGGVEGSGPPASSAPFDNALNALLALEDISIVAAPGSSSFNDTLAAAVNQSLIGHAEARRSYRIAVLDTPANKDPAGARALKDKIDSKYAALYYPWITISNPLAGTDPLQPSQIDVPPSGAVCGIYARSDVQRGVIKAPANETVTGALGLQYGVRFGEQEVLNPLGVNCIRALPNRGIRVWGARTLSSDPEWKYVNIRRYFLYLEASIDRGTQWAVFEPNGERLWANVRTTISDFLYNEWLNGALLGGSPKEAYFVRCDRSTMSQNDLDNGRLVCLIGVAAIKPAEFVIFRIGQKTADGRD